MRKIHKKNPSADLSDFIQEENKKGIEPVYEGGLDTKEEYKAHFFKIREQLVKEQGHICCYCQQRIAIEQGKTPQMKVEHFKPKNLYNGKNYDEDGNLLPDLSLDYYNFLASCKGNTNNKTHCDSCKLGKELQDIPNPSEQAFILFKFRYVAYKITPLANHRKEADRQVNIVALWKDEIEKAQKEGNEHKKNYLTNHDPLTGKEEGCLNLNHQTLASRRFNMAWKSIYNAFKTKFGEKNWHTEKGKELAKQLIEIYDKPDKNGYLKEFCQVAIDLLKKEFKI